MSQSRLALLIGKSPTTIRAWEHGRNSPADPLVVAALAAVLGLDETELLGQAGFEAPVARSRPTARQELTSLATERTEMIALAPAVKAHEGSRPIKPSSTEPVTSPTPISTPPTSIPRPKVRMVVTPQAAPNAGLSGSNGFVSGRSYLEDEAEKDFYRRRGVITAIVLVFMVIVIWWALGRAGGAIADLIEGVVGLLDI